MHRILVLLCFITTLLFGVTALSAAENKPTILFDEGHGQLFLIQKDGELQLTKFAEVIRASGAQVSTTKEPFSDESLKGASALVISGLFKPLQADEVEAVVRFMQKGGRLAVMMHIAPPLNNLIFRLGLGSSVTVLHERENIIDKDINFRLTDLTPHALFTGIDSFSAYGVWAIDPVDKATSIARTSTKAWMDLNNDKILSQGDLIASFAVVVTGSTGAGSYAIFGDDAIFQNKFLEGNNKRLAENLSKWLVAR
jgi:hypothetical protein